MVGNVIVNEIKDEKDKEELKEIFINGKNFVSEENLKEILGCIKNQARNQNYVN